MNIRIEFNSEYFTKMLNENAWLVEEFENHLNGRENDLNYYRTVERLDGIDYIDEDENESVYYDDLVSDEMIEQSEQMVFDFYKSGVWKKS
jgi:hypothetical protein